MEDQEYEQKMVDALNAAIHSHVSTLSEITTNRNYKFEIDKVNRVYIKISVENLKSPVVFSGESFDLFVEGQIGLMQKEEYGSRGRSMEFWIRDASLKFNSETDKFEVVDIGKILFLDFVH